MSDFNQIFKSKFARCIWLASLFFLVVTATVLITGALVRHALLGGGKLSQEQQALVINVAEFPSLVNKIVKEFMGKGDGPLLLIRKKEVEKDSWTRKFPFAGDDGYLLLSGVIPGKVESVVQLIRISDGSVIAKWKPDWSAVNDLITDKKYGVKRDSELLHATHPLLLENGDLIFNTNNALVRLALCKSSPTWVLDNVFHHSNEMDIDGQSIWVPSVYEGYFSNNSFLKEKLRDDSLARVSLDGKILENHSFSKVLMDNGLREFLLGRAGGKINEDPVHINQISIAQQNGKFWKRGDLLISARHLSSIFLYRPSTGKIIWYQLGPWMNQHSVRFVDDHKISIFDNNVFGGAEPTQPFVNPDSVNRVFIYDFISKQATQPYVKQLTATRPITLTQGRAQVLPDGGLFVEETNFGRHLRFSKDGLMWSRVNDYDDQSIGAVSWSRYLTQDEVKIPLEKIRLGCLSN